MIGSEARGLDFAFFQRHQSLPLVNATAEEVLIVGAGGETWSEVAMGRSEVVEENHHMSSVYGWILVFSALVVQLDK